MATTLKDLAERTKKLLTQATSISRKPYEAIYRGKPNLQPIRQRIPFTPAFEKRRSQELAKFRATPFAQKAGTKIYKAFEQKPRLAQFTEGVLTAPRRIVSIGGGVPRQLITEKAPITKGQRVARIGGEMAGAAPYWMLGGKVIEAPLAAKVGASALGKTVVGKALKFGAGVAGATPVLGPFISREGTLKERISPKAGARDIVQDIAFSALLTGALKPVSKLLPEIKLPDIGQIGKIEKQIDELIGYQPTGLHWKQDYAVREKLLLGAKQGAPPAIVKQINKLQDTLDTLRNNRQVYEKIISAKPKKVKAPKEKVISPPPSPIKVDVPLRARITTPPSKIGVKKILKEAKGEIGSVKPPERSFRQTLDTFYTNWVNRFYPLEKIATKIEKEVGAKILPQYSPKYTTKRLLGAGGVATWRHKSKLTPIIDQIDKLGINKNDFDIFLKAKRDIGFGEVGRKIIGSDPIKAQQRIDALGSKYNLNELEGIASKLYQYQDEGLKMLRDAGFIDNTAYKTIKSQNRYYVPFERVMDTVDDYLGLPTRKAQQATQPIKGIKGSKRQILSPLESIIANTFKIESATSKNRVAQSVVGLRNIAPQYADLFKKVKTKMAPVAKVDGEIVFRPAIRKLKLSEITVWENGKKVVYDVGEDIARTVKGLNEEAMTPLLRVLAAPATLLRQGATGRNIDFMIPNIVKDQFDAAINSKYGYKPFIDYIRGLAHMINFKTTGSDEVVEGWLKSGGSIFFGRVSGRKAISEQISEVTQRKSILKQLRTWTIEGIETIGELSETPTRLGLYERGLKKTSNPLLAAYEAREGTLDFARMGAKMKVANSIIPFLNVGVQGFDRLIRTAKDRPAKLALNMALYGAGPAAMVSIYNNLFYPKEYSEVANWEKESNFIIITGRGAEGRPKYIKIPKGNVLPYIANPTDNFITWVAGDNPQSFSEMALSVLTEGLPVVKGGTTLSDVLSRTVGGNLPQIIKPVAEDVANWSFFMGRPIVPFYTEKKPPWEQYTKYTPRVYKRMGDVLNLSPLKIKNLMEGYLAGYVKVPVNIAETLLNIADGKRVSPNTIPIIRRFIGEGLPEKEYAKYEGYRKAEIEEKQKQFEDRPKLLQRIVKPSIEAGAIEEPLPSITKDLKILYKDALNTISGYRKKKVRKLYKEEDIGDLQTDMNEAIDLKKRIEQEYPEKVFEIETDIYRSGGGKKVEERGDWAAEEIEKAIQATQTGGRIVITQGFGNYNPRLYRGGIHVGTDLRARTGTPVTIPQGTWQVAQISETGPYGNSVTVVNNKGESLKFSHLSGISAQLGQTLNQGELVGLTGGTGKSTAPHLDVEYRQNGRLRDVTRSQYGASYLASTALSQDIINKMWDTGVLTTGKKGTAQYIADNYGIDVNSYTGSDRDLAEAIAKANRSKIKTVTFKKAKISKAKLATFKKTTLPKLKLKKAPTIKISKAKKINILTPNIISTSRALPKIKKPKKATLTTYKPSSIVGVRTSLSA